MNKKLIATVLAAGGLLLSASAVQAGAVATSYLNVHDLKLTIGPGTGGAKLIFGVDVGFFGEVNNNGDTNVSLNGVLAGDSNSQPASDGGLDVAASLLGVRTAPPAPGPYANNDFTFKQSPDDTLSNYAIGDVNLEGAIIDFPPGVTDDATARSLSEIGINEAGNSGTSSGNNLGLNGTFVFTIDGTINLSGLADLYNRAFISADVTESDVNADASSKWFFNMRELSGCVGIACIQSFAPGALNDASAVSATTGGNDIVSSFTDLAFDKDFTVKAGVLYQITVDHATEANAHINKDVPEPLPLALMSISLLGLGWSKRRQK